MQLSFRSRILLSCVLVTVLALLVPAWYMYMFFTEHLADTARDKVFKVMDRAVAELEKRQGFADVPELRRWLQTLAREQGVRVVYLAEDGRLIADSGSEGTANAPKWATEPLGSADIEAIIENELIAASKAVTGAGAIPDGSLRVALSLEGFGGQYNRLALGLLLSFAAALALAIVLGLVLAKRLGQSWNEVIDATEAIGKGDYGRRLYLQGGRDFETMSKAVNTMAGHIESHIRTITEQKSRLEAILDGMDEGVMVLDASGRMRSTNRALHMIFPDTENGLGRRPLEVILSPELQHACDEVLSDQTPGRGATKALQIEPVKDSVYDVNIVGLHSEEEGLGAVIVFHDISRLSRLERVRRDFVANVSHELRTPLTSIKGYAETLLHGAEQGGGVKPEAQRTFMGVILKNANHMAKMVEDLMHLARLESGRKPFEIAPVDAADALHQALKECVHLLAEREVHVKETLSGQGAFVLADFDRLVQVFRNLVENAAKYGGAGETIRIWWKEEQGVVTIAVEDNGPGIGREDKARIFERFYRVDKHRGGKDRGGSSGLGLAITKHIVEKLDGRIWVESPAPGNSEGRGSVFYITMPAADVTQAAA